MFDNIGGYCKAKMVGLKHIFASKPHFNFISAHYIWIISATIIASIMMYAGGKGELKYIDALLFASGANTQAGLNPVDVNKLNTFQQIVMYIFPMLSNPITLHGCVVVLRLYWFEKRFQGLVKEVRHRRVPLTRTKSKSRPDDHRRAEEGFNVADIQRVAPQNGCVPRVANDGVVLEDDDIIYPKKAASSSEDSESTVAQAQAQTLDTNQPGQSMKVPAPIWDDENGDSSAPDPKGNGPSSPMPTAITFADTVKRSDGIENNPVNFVQQRPSTDHIAILERQRNQDNEVLRIPGPRETEQGLGPTRLDENDEAYGLSQARTRDSRPDGATIGSRNIRRNATITIAEPEIRQSSRHEDITEDVKAWESTLDTLRLRKPRIFNRSQNKLHEDPAQNSRTRPRSRTLDSFKAALSSGREVDDMPYLSYTPTMGRNSNFIGLTFEQREELGGIEYRSLRTLIFILISYYWGFQLVGITFLLPYIIYNNHYGKIVTDFGIARSWWGFFTSNGAFNDVGFSLTPDSMISFRSSNFVLMMMWFFIIIGNTGFPVMLRFIIWVMSRIVPRGTGLWEELKFLLDHPRRCFTLLFPSAANWWLFLILIILNSVDLIFFIILDLNSENVKGLSVGTRVVNGLFLAASTRTAGFASLNIADLHPAMPVLYMIMMYIGVFPIAISIRRTNVYEEKSLGMYESGKAEDEDDTDKALVTPMSYVGTHLRRQLSFDLWYVSLGFFLLAIAEGNKIKEGRFDMFAILFEIISAYGTVGLSLGASGINASLCSQFSVVGKLIIIAMEIRGRHRGLPYGLDRAVILPSESRLMGGSALTTDQDAFTRTATTNSAPPASATGVQRRASMSSTHRGRSMSRDRNRGLITQLLHPGPAIPPGIVHSHNRTKSTASQDVSFSIPFRRPASMAMDPAVEDEKDEDDRDQKQEGQNGHRDRNRGLNPQFLSPGPAVLPGAMYTHRRAKSSASQDLSSSHHRPLRRPRSMVMGTAVEDDEDDRDNGPTGQAAGQLLTSATPPPAPPRRAKTEPVEL